MHRSAGNTFWGVRLLYLLTVVSVTQASQSPSALSVPVRPNWYGTDGIWSAVSVRVGTPPKWIDLFVSTASSETWVVGAGGCDGTEICSNKRGGIFEKNESRTWEEQGTYYLGLDPQLNFTGRGTYGLDSIALNDKVSLSSQIISSINTTEYWLGFFGLGVKPTNFTNADQKPFLNTIVENRSLVPSHSYGFTAGANHRLKGIPGSLTLGGIDANRCSQDHNVSFSLDPNQNPTVAINQITANLGVSVTGSTPISKDVLLPAQADLFTIDSSTPYFWFPEQVCQAFEKALNLTYDDDLQLYTFARNPNSHDNLVSRNVSFDFTLADLAGSPKTIKFNIPYSAFDLQLSYPFPGLNITQDDPAVNYFPLRKAANNTQYTIGRAFLQETYLIVDYERNNFTLHPAIFSPDALTNLQLLDISRPKNSTWKGPDSGGGPSLSKGAIAGVSIAAVLGFCFLAGLLYLAHKLRRDRREERYLKTKGEPSTRMSDPKNKLANWVWGGEARRYSSEVPPEETRVPELQGKESPARYSVRESEMDGRSPILRGYYERDQKTFEIPYTAINAIGHDPSVPVELPYRSSNYRTSRRLESVQELPHGSDHSAFSELPSPETAHQEYGRRLTKKSSAISSPSDETNPRHSSGPTQIVSPISPDQADEVSSLETVARRAAWYVSNETPSVSSESHGESRRSPRQPATIAGTAGFPAKHSRQNTISSMDRSITSGSPSAKTSLSNIRGSPSAYNKVPRNSRATTNLGRADSTTSGEGSETSTVTNVIRRSVQRGFDWLHSPIEDDEEIRSTRPNTAVAEHSPYSPARWVEFWKTGRDPRLGPTSRNQSAD